MGKVIEVRSLTGHEYNRGGQRWSPQWLPLAITSDNHKAVATLVGDPHLEFRVDGERLSGEALNVALADAMIATSKPATEAGTKPAPEPAPVAEQPKGGKSKG